MCSIINNRDQGTWVLDRLSHDHNNKVVPQNPYCDTPVLPMLASCLKPEEPAGFWCYCISKYKGKPWWDIRCTVPGRISCSYRHERPVLALPMVSAAPYHSILVSYLPTFKTIGGIALSENNKTIVIQSVFANLLNKFKRKESEGKLWNQI